MNALRLDAVSFSYPSAPPVVEACSFHVAPGEMLALLGPSGCGKSTVLRLIAGLLRPQSGGVLLDGESIAHLPPERRGVAMVFQKPLLFPHLTVAENVAFGLAVRRAPEPEIRTRVAQALAMVRLDGLESRRPAQLSGGQEQRVAIARALVAQPRVLLLDEPFTALDENLRAEIRDLVRRIQRELRITSVFVTHDRHEAAAVAHRIAFLHRGAIVQSGQLRDFFTTPATLDTALFFGLQKLPGEVRDGQLHTALGTHAVPHAVDGPVWACFHPESARLDLAPGPTSVDSSIDLGHRAATRLRLPGAHAVEVHHAPPALEPGRSVTLSLSAESLSLFPRMG